ncbi:LutC/YkgG family protein [Negadavirga shengliensis]|uniref:Lactate utilization protein C n=1 Tax=Negadavirga shengliensis TaxID=1389218 RepID=A0ABV9SWN5_9BACT
MSSREQIMEAIQKNKPRATPLPELPAYASPADRTELFKTSLALNGGEAIEVQSLKEVEAWLSSEFSADKIRVSMISDLAGDLDVQKLDDPHELENVEVALLEGEWGVAENAAIWLPEEKLLHRALPFIAQHLAVVLRKDKILGNMHEVYQRIDVSDPGYGVFIAGPSKTADIEQSLVIGAHGPRSMKVFLMD